jgi:predicted NBD/HSP70 family sugar kinase
MEKPAAAGTSERQRHVSDRLLVDNDVRCVTRAVLSRRRDDPGWGEFACVFLGTGVGAGYVLGGSVFYGAGFTAGEVGHMTVHLSPAQHSLRDEPKGLTHRTGPCSCKRQGVHWESLVSGPGLERLADELDHERSALLAERFGAPTRDGGIAAPQITMVAELLEERGPSKLTLDAVDSTIRSAWRRQERDGQPPLAADALPDVRSALADDPGMADYIAEILQTHARYLTVGIENLVNVLNISHLALGGGVIDGLWPLEAYQYALDDLRGDYALKRALAALKQVEHDAELRPGWAWTGSALLFRDPGYVAAAEGRGFAYSLTG